MDHAFRGAAALQAADAQTAISAYTKALVEHPTSPEYYVQRSIAFTRLKPPRHDLSLKDAETAVLCAQKRQIRAKIQAAQQRRVVALYGLGQYQNAKTLLEGMERWRSKDKKDEMEGMMWMAKVKGKLTQAGTEEAKTLTITEYPSRGLPDEKVLKAELQQQLDDDGNFMLEGKASMEESIAADTKNPTTPLDIANGSSHQDSSSTQPSRSESTPISLKIRNEWYQNAQTVTVTLYVKGVSNNAVETEIRAGSVSISFPSPSNPSSTFSFAIDPLFAMINPDTSKHRVLSTKVELTLTKHNPGQKWPSLEGAKSLDPTSATPSNDPTKTTLTSTPASSTSATHVQTQDKPPSYPTSSRNGPKNWDKLATELHAKSKPKKADKPSSKSNSKSNSTGTTTDAPTSTSPPSSDADAGEDPDYDSDFDRGDPVDSFFKKLYAGADADTRRAMMKSFQESNGTALSTNWTEVGKGKVDPVKSRDEDEN